MNFSFSNRAHFIDRLKNETFDLLVIGGGITGAGIALDAASRGLKTALVEKTDFAFGTSSRSTKLIHGGLRYLKQFEFGLVKEVGSERAIVHKLAPHLVIPEKMLLPLYEKRGLGSILTSFGLKLYDWLAGVKLEDRRRMLTRRQTLRQEPLLLEEGIKGGAIYAEYRTDDARLTVEIIKTAVRHGATILNYCKVDKLHYGNGKVSGVDVSCSLEDQRFSIHAKAVVNAAGPWVDELRELDGSKQGKMLHLTKGIHVVIPFSKLPIKQAIYFDVEEDSRMIFAIPRDGITYVGTTDTNYSGSKGSVTATRDDVEYLLRAVNKTFKNISLSLSDVESSWAGLRPLIHEEGKSADEISRKDEIFESKSGMISIAGGKLTGYRKMAERVVDLVIERFFRKRNLKDCNTDQIKLQDDTLPNGMEVEKYQWQIRNTLEAHSFKDESAYLVSHYGRNAEIIVQKAIENSQHNNLSLKHAELWYSFHHEMICKPEDFFVRRTGMLYFQNEESRLMIEQLSSDLKDYFNLSDADLKKEIESVIRLSEALKTFN